MERHNICQNDEGKYVKQCRKWARLALR
jgi:hypothetical protein